MRIISGSVSFRDRFGHHFRVGDHFGVGITSGAVQSLISDRGSYYTGYPLSGTRTIPSRASVHT